MAKSMLQVKKVSIQGYTTPMVLPILAHLLNSGNHYNTFHTPNCMQKQKNLMLVDSFHLNAMVELTS